MLGLERIRRIFEEYQPENDVLVLRRVHIVSERVGHLPQFCLYPKRTRISQERFAFPIWL
jgi:hypothetical protein